MYVFPPILMRKHTHTEQKSPAKHFTEKNGLQKVLWEKKHLIRRDNLQSGKSRVATTGSNSALHQDGICLIQVSLFKISSSKNIILQLHVQRALCSESNPFNSTCLIYAWPATAQDLHLHMMTRQIQVMQALQEIASWPTYACPSCSLQHCIFPKQKATVRQ